MKQLTLKSYLKPAFVICAAILLTAAVGKEIVIYKLGLVMVKQPIELQNPLSDFDDSVLSPYIVRDKGVIGRDILESLGTEEYLQWTLENPNVEADSPLRYCSLFITYYTGNPDMVPHVPDECYVGGGKRRLSGETVKLIIPRRDYETAQLDIPGNDGDTPKQNVGLQYVVFGQTGGDILQDKTFSVQYLFHVNGKYTENRTQTRLVLGSNWKSKYSYFSKVEWTFSGVDAFGRVYPDKEQTLAASKELLATLLPELEKNYWPDWQKANAEDNESGLEGQ